MSAVLSWRASLILDAGLASLAVLGIWLLVGQMLGKLDLWKVVIDARLRQVVLRLIFEIGCFIVSSTVLLLVAVRGDPMSAVWGMIGYASVYSARSIIGPFMQAKAGLMVPPAYMQHPYGPGYSTQGATPCPPPIAEDR